ncbi:hypothetical protein DFH08DRAFT_978339 [Mycena albidolilacea]|uniref:Uncharacterized protein n=1 Tax=Mycena albidolilacea TaxID=1033008 RepID=A0AAD6YZ49_9AGAR|nr:hypothetical protein DFH08DRAFT_978339 [Mycena albidolilacea]
MALAFGARIKGLCTTIATPTSSASTQISRRRLFWAPAATAAYPPPPTSHTASADLAHAGQHLRPPPRNSRLLLRPLCHSADRPPHAVCDRIAAPSSHLRACCPLLRRMPCFRMYAVHAIATPLTRPRDAFFCPCVAPSSLADVSPLQLTLTVDDDSAAAARPSRFYPAYLACIPFI